MTDQIYLLRLVEFDDSSPDPDDKGTGGHGSN